MGVRKKSKSKNLSVHAIAGTDVVLFGLDIPGPPEEGFLGFEIERSQDGKSRWLSGGKLLRSGSRSAGRRADSRTAPIQAFLWGDYEATPATAYTYTIRTKYRGAGDELRTGEEVSIDVTTVDPRSGKHGVYFNRGVAGSQAYNRRFGAQQRFYLFEKHNRSDWKPFIRPDQVSGDAAWTWLSRGLKEALLAFIAQADGPRYALRASVYEFDYLPAIAAFAAALETGADVQIIHHAKRTKRQELRRGGKTVVVESLDPVAAAARAAVRQIGIKKLSDTSRWQNALIDRTDTTISHNKFIVLLEDGKPISVWFGSTNFTAGGIFGQSNVGHVIRDKDVAARYLKYWEKLKNDPPRKRASASSEEMGMQDWNIHVQPDLTAPPAKGSITTIFSPRPTTNMLQWYADQLGKATSSVHFTAAFGVSQQIARELAKSAPKGAPDSYLRYIMLESRPPKAAAKSTASASAAAKPAPTGFDAYKNLPCNRIAWGDLLAKEVLSGLNVNVDYLHTKYLLIDPLTDHPIVITGSANFSDNSTTMNDENMNIICGDRQLAETYLTEFMRLFNHFRHRNDVNAKPKAKREAADFLADDNSWALPYFTPGTQKYAERLLFR